MCITSALHALLYRISSFSFFLRVWFSLPAALLRQTDVNWLAYFFVTDQVPFENRLRKILNNYADKRLQYVPLDHAHRPAVSPEFFFILSLYLIFYLVFLGAGCQSEIN